MFIHNLYECEICHSDILYNGVENLVLGEMKIILS